MNVITTSTARTVSNEEKKKRLKCIIDVSYGVALLFWTRGGGWLGWPKRGGYGVAMGVQISSFY